MQAQPGLHLSLLATANGWFCRSTLQRAKAAAAALVPSQSSLSFAIGLLYLLAISRLNSTLHYDLLLTTIMKLPRDRRKICE